MHHEHHEDCACDQPQEGCGCGHDHTHEKGCDCGHEHTHEDGCDCGHEHTHEDGCGCGHHHEHLVLEEGSITEAQAEVLLAIHQRGYLPIARFALRSSRDPDAFAVALEPVYVTSTEDDMDMVKANGELFESLEDLGLITLDYDIRLKGYAYAEFEQSNLYAYFVETVKEAAQKPEFLLDTPVLELGSMALTGEGHEVLRSMLEK